LVLPFLTSPSYDDAQGDLFNEVECEASSDEQENIVTTTTTKKVRGKRKPLPKNLPRERIVLDLDDAEKVCSCCQHPLHKIGEDSSEKLEFTPVMGSFISNHFFSLNRLNSDYNNLFFGFFY